MFLIKLLFLTLIVFSVFLYLGKKLYLKEILKANFYFKNKKIKKFKLNKKCKKNIILISYLKKEVKLILRNPVFCIQIFYTVILLTIVVCTMIGLIVPQVIDLYNNNEEIKEMINNLRFDIEAVCIILGIIQIVGLFNYSSITAFSREGKNAYIIKILPINVYKQFIYKNIPQILLNVISSIAILSVIKIYIPVIELKYIFIMFVLSLIFTIINSFILSLIDLLMPKLKWDTEYEILKNNRNKLLQYVLIVINIFILIFFNKLFKEYNLDNGLYSFIGILFFILILFNYFINKKNNKLFKKIK